MRILSKKDGQVRLIADPNDVVHPFTERNKIRVSVLPEIPA
jgi:hypothetical protein